MKKDKDVYKRQVENTTFHNDRQNVEFQLTKLEQEIDKIEQEGDGVTIHYKDVPANDIDFGLYTKEAMSDGKGGTIAADTLVSVKTVKKGQANTVENLPAGNYYLKELSTKDHLEDNNFRYEVTYAIQGNDPLVVVQANKGEAIKNYYVERPFEFAKKDVSDGMLIPGITVNVYDETGENIIFTGKTNENGEITITLPVSYTHLDVYKRQGMATSSIISEKVREILDKNDIQYTLSQVQLSELEMYKGADLFITSMKLQEDYGLPVVVGTPFLIGIGEDEAAQKILDILKN